MRVIRRTAQFKKDVKRVEKRVKDLGELRKVLETLLSGEKLAPQCRDRVLVGQYKGTRECHL
jgi:mRNA interferase YafQ